MKMFLLPLCASTLWDEVEGVQGHPEQHNVVVLWPTLGNEVCTVLACLALALQVTPATTLQELSEIKVSSFT